MATNNDEGSLHDDSERPNSVVYSSTNSVNAEDEIIGQQESSRVNTSKRMVYLFICIAAAIAGWGTSAYMRMEDKAWVDDEFGEFAGDVVETSLSRLVKAEIAALALADAITSYAWDRRDVVTWPNVTIPDFHVRAATIKQLMGAEVIAFAPLVNEIDSETSHRFPVWQLDPAPADLSDSPMSMDLLSIVELRQIMEEVIELRRSALSPIIKDHHELTSYQKVAGPREEAVEEQENSIEDNDANDLPRSMVVEPVYETFEPDAKLVGVVVGVLSWVEFFDNILNKEAEGLIIDLENTCDGLKDSFRITEFGPKWVGPVETDPRYNDVTKRVRFGFNLSGSEDDDGRRLRERRRLKDNSGCGLDLVIHMSESFTDNWKNSRFQIYPAIIVSIFALIGLIFLFYDIAVQRRQEKVMKTATRNERLVSTLFPEAVRRQLIEEDEARRTAKQKKGQDIRQQFADYEGADDDDNNNVATSSKAIAQLFSDATIMFADIVGFTSWSSAREPCDVFTLLEKIYGAFDKIASRRGVFKVETIGDCYLAVCGLPDPNPDHASVMAQFAWDCLHTMKRLVRELEVRLGPDTGDLSMRAGLHSGPVTAGVLRGLRARFQLFGDTVNTAARMESTGKPGKVQISCETAKLLMIAGENHWIQKREEKVVAKGKGEMETYWLDLGKPKTSISTSSTRSGSARHIDDLNRDGSNQIRTRTVATSDSINAKHDRLQDWCAETLGQMLCDVVQAQESTRDAKSEQLIKLLEADAFKSVPLDEVKDVVSFTRQTGHRSLISVQDRVRAQLRQFVGDIASMYRNNPFHNFNHACHVVHSTVRLMDRSTTSGQCTNSDVLLDPLTKFSLVLAALLHDINHSGVSNARLVEEQTTEAVWYQNKCVAEQTAIDSGWKVLMKNEYTDLRRAIYTSPEEFYHFRQVIVNCIIATDIFDAEQIAKRSSRWRSAFGDDGESATKAPMKMTIFLEHLIQASDVSHTMQHWFVYRKWNEMFFLEMYKAHVDGRLNQDPTEFWYEMEINFFDQYIIPLAEKLVEFGCLIQSNDEMLSYAHQNRTEWVQKGRDIVVGMKEKAAMQYPMPMATTQEI